MIVILLGESAGAPEPANRNYLLLGRDGRVRNGVDASRSYFYESNCEPFTTSGAIMRAA